MIRIDYVTRTGKHCIDQFDDPAELADRLERLWKARIEATAYRTNSENERCEIVGAVQREPFANLVWWCESVDYFSEAEISEIKTKG